MYSENNRRYAARRADEEFLRRMTGGEFSANGLPVINLNAPSDAPRSTPTRDARVRVSCNGSTNGATPESACKPDAFAPSLAMVYSPRQCWRGLLTPAEGLSKGTIFSELVLPFEAGENHAKEVTIRRPM